VKVGQKEALEAQGNAKQADSDDGFAMVSDDDEIDELEDELEKDEQMSQGSGKGYAPKDAMADKLQTSYESDDNDLMAKLHKLEEQDDSFKAKIMQQNKHDDQKADIVKEQKRVYESMIGQLMTINKYLNKVNQMPQSDNYQNFKDNMPDKFADLEHAFTSPSTDDEATVLNNTNTSFGVPTQVCNLLGNRLGINSISPSSTSNFGDFVNQIYKSTMPKCEDLVQKWHARTQVDTNVLNKKLNKKNSTLSSLQQPILTQVIKTLENKKYIDTRTHQKHEVYRVLGKPTENINEKIDFQIYDDYEFYQGIIKDFLNSEVTTGSANQSDLLNKDFNVHDDLALTQEYLKKRERMKKARDKKTKKSNKISKDRKIKYIIHDPLINFMAPQDEHLLDPGRKDILNFMHYKNDKA
jgi:protein AATF/BFR2